MSIYINLASFTYESLIIGNIALFVQMGRTANFA